MERIGRLAGVDELVEVVGMDLTSFNKIAIPNNTFQMASGQGNHWLIESPILFSCMCSPPLLLSIFSYL